MSVHRGVSEITTKFKQYNSNLFEVWEDYLFLEYYMPHIHQGLKNETIPDLEFESIYTEKKEKFTKKFVYGVIDRLKKKHIPETAFLEVVSLTENYLQQLTFRLYRDFPHKLETKDETVDQQFKILKTIIESVDRDEIIDKISEEKIRSIFYGKPVDFFKTDKAKIGVKNYIKSTYNLALDNFEEVIARRNIFTHNRGKVDRKYLREVNGAGLKLGEKVFITKDYLKYSIRLMLGLCAVVTKLSLKDNYNIDLDSEKFSLRLKSFDKEYKGK